MFSYDCNCQYCVNLVARITRNFLEFLQIIELTRCTIPALHIEDHKDWCKYHFNTAYIPCCGHFHGEMAEAPWVESNQLGPAMRQMNNGHRMGVITFHYSYWNWLKITKMHVSLFKVYKEARELFQEKRNIFLSLCILYEDQIAEWQEMARKAKHRPNGIIEGIYQHSVSKGAFLMSRHMLYCRLKYPTQ